MKQILTFLLLITHTLLFCQEIDLDFGSYTTTTYFRQEVDPMTGVYVGMTDYEVVDWTLTSSALTILYPGGTEVVPNAYPDVTPSGSPGEYIYTIYNVTVNRTDRYDIYFYPDRTNSNVFIFAIAETRGVPINGNSQTYLYLITQP